MLRYWFSSFYEHQLLLLHSKICLESQQQTSASESQVRPGHTGDVHTNGFHLVWTQVCNRDCMLPRLVQRRSAGGSLLWNAGPNIFRSHALPQEFVEMKRTRHELDVTRHLHSGQYQRDMSVLTSALAF